jgi:hypothetical protein
MHCSGLEYQSHYFGLENQSHYFGIENHADVADMECMCGESMTAALLTREEFPVSTCFQPSTLELWNGTAEIAKGPCVWYENQPNAAKHAVFSYPYTSIRGPLLDVHDLPPLPSSIVA